MQIHIMFYDNQNSILFQCIIILTNNNNIDRKVINNLS